MRCVAEKGMRGHSMLSCTNSEIREGNVERNSDTDKLDNSFVCVNYLICVWKFALYINELPSFYITIRNQLKKQEN